MSPNDRRIVETQKFCVVLSQSRLGSMGTPIKLEIEDKTLFLCCMGCREKALSNPTTTLAMLDNLLNKLSEKNFSQSKSKPQSSSLANEIAEALAELSTDDQMIAKKQRFCALLAENQLGSMGTPIKLMIEGQPVFLCCDACRESALSNPQSTLGNAKKLSGAKRD